ncbi:MAG: hypothetical protein ABSG91_02645 [Syntrophobacteraceae bacterium]
MKGIGFMFVILISGLLVLAGWTAGIASNSDEAGTLSKTKTLENRIGPPRQLMADRIDTKDSIIYGTDPDMERAMDEQAREEKEKEKEAWKMLQNMQLYQNIKRPPRSTQPDTTPQQ